MQILILLLAVVVVPKCANEVCKAPPVTVGVVQSVKVSLAQSKANRMAKCRVMRHWGGGFGKGRSEGVGTASTRERAIRNCCYWGCRTPVDIGAAKSGRRWYACVIYR